MESPRTVAHIDGGLLQDLNCLLGGFAATPISLVMLEAFIEAVVLRDSFVPSFNWIAAGDPNQRQIEDFFANKGVIQTFDLKKLQRLRKTKTANTSFALFHAEDIAGHIIDFDRKRRTESHVAAPAAFRDYLRSKLADAGDLRSGYVGEVEDMITISELLRMDLVIRPEWIPFVFPKNHSVPIDLYRKLARIHRTQLDKLVAYLRPHTIYLPPLLSIVLDRAHSREDLLDAVWATREDFTSLRNASADLEARILDEERLGDQLDALAEYEDQIASLTEKTRRRKRGLIEAVWEFAKDLMKPTELLNTTYNKHLERQRLRRVEGYYDLWTKARDVSNYSSGAQRVFGNIEYGTNDVFLDSVSAIERILNPRRD